MKVRIFCSLVALAMIFSACDKDQIFQDADLNDGIAKGLPVFRKKSISQNEFDRFGKDFKNGKTIVDEEIIIEKTQAGCKISFGKNAKGWLEVCIWDGTNYEKHTFNAHDGKGGASHLSGKKIKYLWCEQDPGDDDWDGIIPDGDWVEFWNFNYRHIYMVPANVGEAYTLPTVEDFLKDARWGYDPKKHEFNGSWNVYNIEKKAWEYFTKDWATNSFIQGPGYTTLMPAFTCKDEVIEWAPYTVEPTCCTEGYDVIAKNLETGEEWYANYTPRLGHTFSSDPVWDATANDWLYPPCDVCGWAGYYNNLCVQPEIFIEYTVEPTCTLEGYDVLENTLTGEKWFSNYVPALGHDFQSIVHDGDGCWASQCTRCDWEGYVECPLPEWVITVVPPTCTTEGYTERWHTPTDGKWYEDYVPALGHDFQSIVDDGSGCWASQCTRCDYEGYVDCPGPQKGEVVIIEQFFENDSYVLNFRVLEVERFSNVRVFFEGTRILSPYPHPFTFLYAGFQNYATPDQWTISVQASEKFLGTIRVEVYANSTSTELLRYFEFEVEDDFGPRYP